MSAPRNRAERRSTTAVEHRVFRNVEVRATDKKGPNGRPVVQVRAITPFVVDDYGSVWLPTTFDGHLQARIAADPDDTPSLCWAHRWDDPIGHGISYTPDEGGPFLEFELDDFDAVPRARQADAQVRSKTIRDCSVGFSDVTRRSPTPDEEKRWPGVWEIIEAADMDELSLVLRGAVPGAKVTAVRKRPRGSRTVLTFDDDGDTLSLDVEDATDIILRLGQGDIDLADALAEVKAKATADPDAGEDDPEGGEDGDGEKDPPDPDGDEDDDPDDIAQVTAEEEAAAAEAALQADIDAALAVTSKL